MLYLTCLHYILPPFNLVVTLLLGYHGRYTPSYSQSISTVHATQQPFEAPVTVTAGHTPGPIHPTNAPTPTPTSQSNTLSSIVSSQPPSSTFSSRNPPITTYQSARQKSSTQNRLFPSAPIHTTGVGSLYGNGQSGLPANVPTPPQSMVGPGTGLGTSFLGFQQRTGQANQTRLAAAAHNIPRRPALQTRRHHLNALTAPSSSQASSAFPQSRPHPPHTRSRRPASACAPAVS